MIPIDQLLESVDLDFEPRWVTKDECGCIKFFSDTPRKFRDQWICDHEVKVQSIYPIKISDFANKKWQECIYEVPRKVNYGKLVGKLCRFYDKTTDRRTYGLLAYRANGVFAVCGTSSTFDCCEPVLPDDDVIYKGE